MKELPASRLRNCQLPRQLGWHMRNNAAVPTMRNTSRFGFHSQKTSLIKWKWLSGSHRYCDDESCVLKSFKRCQQLVDLAACCVWFKSNRVVRYQEIPFAEFNAKIALQFMSRHQFRWLDRVHPKSTYIEHRGWVLTQLHHPPAVLFCSYEMNMGHFGNGVPYSFVHCSLSHLPSMDVPNWQSVNHRGKRSTQKFVSVAKQKKQIVLFLQKISENPVIARRRIADSGWIVIPELQVNLGEDWQFIHLNLFVGIAKFFR